MLSQHIALVPEAGGVNASELARVCAALQKQLTRDFLPIWGISATIDAFPHLEDVPLGYWPIIITFCDLGDQAGVHIDRNGQPYAQVEMTAGWSLHASQACLDMLVNPYGRKLMAGPSPRPDQGPVEFLLEVGSPCSNADCAYVIDEVLVSDFCTPAFWGSLVSNQGAFSFTGSLQSPQHVLPGGHLTWHDPISDKWWLRHHHEHALVDTKLGNLDGRMGVVREAMRLRAPHAVRVERMTIEAFESRLGVRRQHALQASQFHAHRLRTVMASDAPPPGADPEGSRLIEPRPVKSIPAEGSTTARLYARGASRAYLPKYPEDDIEVEVTQKELLAEEERILANLKDMGPPVAPVRSTPPRESASIPASVRSKPPPLPEEPRPSEAPRAAQPFSPPSAPSPQPPIVQPPLPQAQLSQAPRATPLPPPRMPERWYNSTTVPPVAMGQFSTVPPRPPVNKWTLAASLLAAAAVSVLAFALYTRATSLPNDTGSRAAGNGSPVVATQVAAPVASTTIAPAQPATPAPTAPIATAQPAATAATPTVATPLAASAPLAPAPPKMIRRAPAAAPAARGAAAPADESDPLEGLIGERR